ANLPNPAENEALSGIASYNNRAIPAEANSPPPLLYHNLRRFTTFRANSAGSVVKDRPYSKEGLQFLPANVAPEQETYFPGEPGYANRSGGFFLSRHAGNHR